MDISQKWTALRRKYAISWLNDHLTVSSAHPYPSYRRSKIYVDNLAESGIGQQKWSLSIHTQNIINILEIP